MRHLRRSRNDTSRDHWTTPRQTIEELCAILGIERFDFDPCSNASSVVGAAIEWRMDRDGDSLSKDWPPGATFVNPPYSAKARDAFIERVVSEANAGRQMAILVPMAGAAKWARKLMAPAKSVLIPKYRLKFGNGADGGMGAPFDCMVYVFNAGALAPHERWTTLGTVRAEAA